MFCQHGNELTVGGIVSRFDGIAEHLGNHRIITALSGTADGNAYGTLNAGNRSIV